MLERLFQLKAHNTNVRTEILAGVTTFLAMAYALSSRVSEKSTAAGLALGVWFFFVLLFDLALLALLVIGKGQLSANLLPWLLLLNPTDLYRLINLPDFGAELGGVLTLGRDLAVPVAALWLALCAWNSATGLVTAAGGVLFCQLGSRASPPAEPAGSSRPGRPSPRLRRRRCRGSAG